MRHRLRDVVPGALLAAVMFELLEYGFASYVTHFNRYELLYGALGGVMLFMVWTYLSSLVMLFCAELASQFERASAGRAPVVATVLAGA